MKRKQVYWYPETAVAHINGTQACNLSQFRALDPASIIQIGLVNQGLMILEGIGSLPRLDMLDCSVNRIRELDIRGSPVIIGLQCDTNGMEQLEVAGVSTLQTLSCDINFLKRLDLWGCRSLIDCTFSANQFSAEVVDDILFKLNYYSVQNGNVSLDMIGIEKPTYVGLAIKASLEAKGWTVTIN